MKKAIAIHGNLRTFLMPRRENGTPLYLNFLDTVINPNLDDDLDVYISTDANDFYYNGAQYYTKGSIIECTNNNSFRMHDKIKIIDFDSAREIIENEIRRIIPNIKYLNIAGAPDPLSHPSYNKLITCGFHGVGAEPLINQNHKVYDLHKAINDSGKTYDAILRIRFDLINHGNFNLSSVSLHDGVIYTPGVKDIFCFDWYMFSNQRNMGIFMSLHDRLGYTTEYPTCLLECPRCGTKAVENWDSEKNPREGNLCPFCRTQGAHFADITLSNEHHIGRQAILSGISPSYGGVHTAVYRYDDVANDSSEKLNKILSDDEIKGCTFVNYGVRPAEKSEKIL